METTEKQIEKVLYWRSAEAENRKKVGAEAAAQALNSVYKHYKFKNITEIPSNVQQWMTKRTLETNPDLAKLAQTHKLETLIYDTPQWIREAGQAFSNWHSVKNGLTQSLQYCALVDEKFVVDYEMLEQEFENSETYRRYFKTAEQLKRLEQCKVLIGLLEEAEITFPSKYLTVFNLTGNPWLRVIGGKYFPCREYVLTGAIIKDVMPKTPDYILESVMK